MEVPKQIHGSSRLVNKKIALKGNNQHCLFSKRKHSSVEEKKKENKSKTPKDA